MADLTEAVAENFKLAPRQMPKPDKEDDMADTIQPGDDILLTRDDSDEQRVAKVAKVDGGVIRLADGSRIRDDLPKRNADGMWTYHYSRSGGE